MDLKKLSYKFADEIARLDISGMIFYRYDF